MAYGLKVWDATGTNVLVDTSLQTARFIDSGAITCTTSGTFDSRSGTGGPGGTFDVSGGGDLKIIVVRTSAANNFSTLPPNVTTFSNYFTITGEAASATLFYYAFLALS